ncbi:hypothetical protein SOASR031_11550 [Leminorella grimontii]|nr:hypothetical protein SOASR031_11550 [Leminorella grimontii]
MIPAERLKPFAKCILKARFVTIFAKPAGKPLVDDYVVDIPQDTWIEQPWDMGITFVKPIGDC